MLFTCTELIEYNDDLSLIGQKTREKKKSILFSSPEHEVLMVSYCDRAASVVRRPSLTFYLVYALEATVLVGYS